MALTMRVFFSHGTQDYTWVQSIVAQVDAMGLRGYVYEHDPQPGQPIAPKIKRAITRSHIFVVFLTLNSHDAPYVQQEIGYAQGKGKLIVPFVERGVPERSLAMLKDIERITFDPLHLQEATNQLWAALSRYALGLVNTLSDEMATMAGIEDLSGLGDFADLHEFAAFADDAASLGITSLLTDSTQQGGQQQAQRRTPPLLTLTVSGTVSIDQELVWALLGFALLAALLGVVAYAATHQSDASGG